MAKYNLRLYVAGDTDLSRRAIGNLDQLCNDTLKDCCEITVIDVLQSPDMAREDRVIATPMLVRHSPLPVMKAIGDLSDTSKLISGLGLDPSSSNT